MTLNEDYFSIFPIGFLYVCRGYSFLIKSQLKSPQSTGFINCLLYVCRGYSNFLRTNKTTNEGLLYVCRGYSVTTIEAELNLWDSIEYGKEYE